MKVYNLENIKSATELKHRTEAISMSERSIIVLDTFTGIALLPCRRRIRLSFCAGVSPASKAVSVMDCTLLQCSFHCSYACFFSAAVAIAVLFYAHLFGVFREKLLFIKR